MSRSTCMTAGRWRDGGGTVAGRWRTVAGRWRTVAGRWRTVAGRWRWRDGGGTAAGRWRDGGTVVAPWLLSRLAPTGSGGGTVAAPRTFSSICGSGTATLPSGRARPPPPPRPRPCAVCRASSRQGVGGLRGVFRLRRAVARPPPRARRSPARARSCGASRRAPRAPPRHDARVGRLDRAMLMSAHVHGSGGGGDAACRGVIRVRARLQPAARDAHSLVERVEQRGEPATGGRAGAARLYALIGFPTARLEALRERARGDLRGRRQLPAFSSARWHSAWSSWNSVKKRGNRGLDPPARGSSRRRGEEDAAHLGLARVERALIHSRSSASATAAVRPQSVRARKRGPAARASRCRIRVCPSLQFARTSVRLRISAISIAPAVRCRQPLQQGQLMTCRQLSRERVSRLREAARAEVLQHELVQGRPRVAARATAAVGDGWCNSLCFS